jgi:hypothetical protein
MTTLPPEVDFKVDKSASPDRMNRAMEHLVARLAALETYKPNFDALFAQLQQVGLNRINDGILPVYERLASIEALGFLNAPIEPGTAAAFALGPVAVTIAADRRSAFTPSPWVAMVRTANPNDYVLGRVSSYDRISGALVLDIANLWGAAGQYFDVTVWGVAGGALSALESAQRVAVDRTAAHSDRLAADADAAATAADRAAVHTDKLAADANAANAGAAATAAAGSAAAAAASVASIAGGPVASVNGRTGVVTGMEEQANKGVANGYAALDSSGKIPASQLPPLAASATIDATNAANISSGVLPDGRVPKAAAADVRSGADNAKFVTSFALSGSAAEQTLADAATILWDMSLGYNARATLGGNRTLAAPTNAIAGLTYVLRVVQDATGSRTLAWSSCFNWGVAGAPALTTTAGKHDLVSLYCTAGGASPSFDCSIAKGF